MNSNACLITPAGIEGGYPSRLARHHVDFFCHAPDAAHVSLIGDFNGWRPEATPMRRMPDGNWMASLDLLHGHHQYLFVVDGKRVLDPNASGRARNERDETVSLVPVS